MSSVLYAILFLFMHACSGRRLGLATDKINTNSKVQDVHNSILHATCSKVQNFELQGQENQIAENGENGQVQGTSDAAHTTKEKDSTATAKESSKGSMTAMAYAQEPTTTEGWKRQARSTLGYVSNKNEEPVNSNDNDITEDVVVMDYAQPHRKPPIHNIEP